MSKTDYSYLTLFFIGPYAALFKECKITLKKINFLMKGLAGMFLHASQIKIKEVRRVGEREGRPG